MSCGTNTTRRITPVVMAAATGCAVRHDAERRASLRRDDPEISDVGVQRRRGFEEPDLHAMHECAGDAHPSIRL
jgi:hypothetical protein